jgi:hypothetical protein
VSEEGAEGWRFVLQILCTVHTFKPGISYQEVTHTGRAFLKSPSSLETPSLNESP